MKRVLRESRRQVRSLAAAVDAIEMLESRRLLSITLNGLPSWAPMGPNPIVAGNNDNVTGPSAAQSIEVGAANAIAVDPNNAKHLFVGTVDGGIWQTTDFTVANPNWTTTTDAMPSLAISAIAFSPSNSSVMYAGTGSYSSTFGGVGGTGLGGPSVGIYKSTDSGATWNVLNPSGIFTGLRILRVVPTTLNGGQTVFAATTDTGVNTGGVYRSDDGGTNWTRLSGSNGLPNAGVTDLAANPSNANQYFAALAGGSGSAGTGGIFRVDLSVNTTWTNITGNINTLAAGVLNGAARVELSVSGAATNPIWASVINSSGFYSDVFHAANIATPAWTAVGPGGLPPDILEGNQGGTHGAILADPNQANIVYLGGDARQNVSPFSGYLARGDSTANTWTALTPVDNQTANPGLTVIPTANGVSTAPHPDTRNMVFGAGGVLLLGCDGGVYQATNPTGSPTWTSINGNIQDTEFYQVSLDNRNTATTTDDLIQGAAQDNSASERDTAGNWNTQVGGDGVIVGADPISDTRYFSVQNFFMGRAIGGGGVTRPAGTVAGTGGKILNKAIAGTKAETFGFRPAFAVNQGDIANNATARIILGGNKTLYVSSDQGSNYTSIGTPVSNNPVAVTNLTAAVQVIAFGDQANTNVCYVAMSDGNIAATTNITTAGGGFSLTTFSTAASGALAQDIVIDPNDPQTVYVTTQGGVFETTNGGTSWTNTTDNLNALASPGFPTFSNQIGERSVALFDNSTASKADDILIEGGPGGVFRRAVSAAVGGATWSQFGAALPSVLVGSVVYDALSDTLLAGTFGRGAWEVSNASATISTPGILQIDGDTDYAGEDDTIRLVLDPANNQMLDVFLNNNSNVPDFQAPLASIQQINVNGLGGNDTLILDSSNGLISVPNGTRFDGGTGTDNVQLVQTNGPAINSDVYTVGPDTGQGTSVITGNAGGVQKLFFENIEPVTDLVPAGLFVVNATPENNNINMAQGSLPNRALITIDNYESIEFANKANVQIVAGAGNDTINFDDPTLPAGLNTVRADAGDGDDVITTNSGLNPAVGVIFNGGAGNDSINASGAGGAVVSTITGGDGADTLIGTVASDSVNGGTGDDVMDARGGNNTVTGGGGNDTLLVSGTPGADTITVTNVGTSINITGGASAGNNQVSGITHVQVNAGSGADSITITPGAAGGINYDVVGGDPIGAPGDSLTVNTTSPVSFTGGPTSDSGSFNSSTVTPTDISFIQIEALSVTGGGTMSINGTNGADTITVIARDSSTFAAADGVQDFTVAVNAGPQFLFINTPGLTIHALAGDDLIDVIMPAPNHAAWNVQMVIDGGSPGASDKFVLETPNQQVAVDYSPSGTAAGTVTVAQPTISQMQLVDIEQFNYVGGGDGDTLAVHGTSGDDSIAVTPGATTDGATIQVNNLLGITFSGLGSAGIVQADGAGGNDTLVYNGTGGNDNFTIGALGQLNLNSQLTVFTPAVENVSIQGFNGDDTLTLVPAVQNSPFTTITFDGGAQASVAGDKVNLIGTANNDAFTISGQNVSAGGHAVNSTGAETINLNAGAGADQLTYTGVAGTSENITVSASPTAAAGTISIPGVALYNLTGSEFITVNGNTGGGAGDTDTLTFAGTTNPDLFNINLNTAGTQTAPVATVNTMTGATLMTLVNYTGIATLGIAGQDGADRFNVYTGPNVGRNIFIDGGLPTAKKKETDVLYVYYVSPRPRIIQSTATQNPGAGLVTLDYGTAKDLIQYTDIENTIIGKV